MSDSVNSPPVVPESAVPTGAPDRADLRPENIQDAVIRLAGNSQDGDIDARQSFRVVSLHLIPQN